MIVSSNWYVTRAVPGQYKRALSEFMEAGIEAYCPMVRREIRHHQTKAWIMREFQLFTGYVFAKRSNGVFFEELHRMRYVRSVLGGVNGPISIPDTEVEAIKEAEARGEFDILRPPPITTLKPDSRVYIQTGPLAGHYASVVKPKGKKAIKAVVESLGNAREIELSIANLKLVA